METGTPGPPPAPESPAAGAAITPTGDVPRLQPGSGPPSAPYPVITEFDRQDEYSRLLPLVKWLLLIPHWFALVFVGFAAYFAIIGAFFAVLFTGRYPRGIHRFVTGVFRWSQRVYAYGLLMTDRYPPFSLEHDEDYPARFDIAYTERIANWRPLVHWLLAIPYAIVGAVLIWIAYFVVVVAFFSILFTKKFPETLFDFNVVALRWQNRSTGYSLWLTERYPPWQWG